MKPLAYSVIALLAVVPFNSKATELFTWSLLYRVPMNGAVDCVVKGETVRIDSMSADWERWLSKGERVLDTCVNPSSVIFTDYGARAQFVYGTSFQEGNNYGSSWVEANCKSMEKRSSTGWEMQLFKPSDAVKQARARYGGKFSFSPRTGYWTLYAPMAWTRWEVMTSQSAPVKWLCQQWRSRAR